MYGKQLLCVDDDPEAMQIRKLLLESNGYSVMTANSGEEALTLLRQANRVDLVLMDYLMPGMNGDELAEHLRQRFPSLPIVAVSGVDELPDRLLKNVDANVPKGHDPERLLSAITEALSRLEPEE
ncbi:MAG: response regulator [Acidobacteria bacterium]|nr:response regulator [Acidobacteriota bacterium]MBV9484207.1 response regulator [Acidobacteriota bacterium]